MHAAKTTIAHRLGPVMLTAATLAVLPGCLITAANRSDESGVPISMHTLDQVQPGSTTEQWLVSALGEPTSRTPANPDGSTSILRYDHQVTEKSAGAVFLLFGGSNHTTRVKRTYFEVTNGIVTRYWTERGK